MSGWKLALSLLVGMVALVGGTVAFVFLMYANQPAGTQPREVRIQIEPGMTLRQVSGLLARKRVIGNPTTFSLYTVLKGRQSQIQAGEYQLSPTLKPEEILHKLVTGDTVVYTLTIPEGYRLSEIAGLLESRGLADAERFRQAVRDPQFLQAFGLSGGTLEGYLFPDTYQFRKRPTETELVRIMTDTFRRRAMKPEYLERARELGFSFHQIVTLASLIEKETGRPEERPLISAVFHNRLKRKMKLQTDPTVIYALAHFDGNIRKKDLSVDSPYNTYRYRGLPPGPIASPGLESIHAALYPADSQALYFVSRQDGSHHFSTSLEEHNRAVLQYQIKPAKG